MERKTNALPSFLKGINPQEHLHESGILCWDWTVSESDELRASDVGALLQLKSL